MPGPARFVLTVFYTEGLAWGVARTERRRIVIGVYTTLEKAQEKAVAYARVRPGLNAAKPGPTTRTGAPGKAATTGSRSSKRTTMDAEIREAERRLEALRARAGLSPKVYVLRTWRGGVTEILRVTTLFDGGRRVRPASFRGRLGVGTARRRQLGVGVGALPHRGVQPRPRTDAKWTLSFAPPNALATMSASSSFASAPGAAPGAVESTRASTRSSSVRRSTTRFLSRSGLRTVRIGSEPVDGTGRPGTRRLERLRLSSIPVAGPSSGMTTSTSFARKSTLAGGPARRTGSCSTRAVIAGMLLTFLCLSSSRAWACSAWPVPLAGGFSATGVRRSFARKQWKTLIEESTTIGCSLTRR